MIVFAIISVSGSSPSLTESARSVCSYALAIGKCVRVLADAVQIPNECLIWLSIAMMASVYLPWVKYRSTCDALDSAMTAIAKPLSMTFAFGKRRV